MNQYQEKVLCAESDRDTNRDRKLIKYAYQRLSHAPEKMALCAANHMMLLYNYTCKNLIQ